MSTPPLAPADSAPAARATVADLMRAEGQAELIAGRIVHQPLHGFRVGRIVGRLSRRLHDHAEQFGKEGEAFTSTVAYVLAVPLRSGRESFSPDVSFYDGPLPADPMGPLPGPPTFAAEVRWENDYGLAAERDIAVKRRDYFEAGTRLVWDVDPVAETVHAYTAEAPDQPVIFRRGQTADAGSVVLPGWQVALDWLFA